VATVWRVACWLVTGTLLWTASDAQAAPPGPPLAPRAPQLMLYISRPIGGGVAAGMQPKIGLRLSQVRQAPNLGDPEAGAAFQHRELLDWAIQGRSDMQLQLGHRVTWDFTRQAFGRRGAEPAFAMSVPRLRGRPDEEAKPNTLTPERGVRQTSVEPGSLRELAAMSASDFTAARLMLAPRKPQPGPGAAGHANYPNLR
jgi:hypothetical protein